MRRLFLLLSLSLTFTLLFTACMGDDDDDGTATTGSPTTAAVSPDTDSSSTATTTDSASGEATPAATGTTTTSAATSTPADSSNDATATTTSGTANATPTDDAAPTATNTPEDQPSLIAEIESETARIRALDYLQDVPVTIISREELSTNLLADIEADYPAEDAAADALELWLLRLVPERNFDLLQFQLDLLGEQVAGYYDPEIGEMFLVDDSGNIGGSTILTLAHELTHALQDQHFNLTALQSDELGADESTAVLTLIEGDAESVSYEYIELLSPTQLAELFADALSVDTTILDNAPAYLADSLYFPYEYGVSFVDELLAEGGREAVDAAFADPPTSTEQILHPEKYLAAQRDEPVIVNLPDFTATLGVGWTLVDEDTLGEFDLQVLLADNGADDPEGGADGWGGATYAVYQQGTAPDAPAVAIVGTTWDTPEDAEQFRTELLSTLDASAADSLWTDADGRVHRLLEANGTIYLISGTTSTAVEAAIAAIGA